MSQQHDMVGCSSMDRCAGWRLQEAAMMLLYTFQTVAALHTACLGYQCTGQHTDAQFAQSQHRLSMTHVCYGSMSQR
jgi:hypothetical protein